jgi:RHS repeat-associated protein
MLKDDEVFNGSGNSYTTYFRQHDTRLGRWFSVDPEFQPWQSPYTSMDNNPIMFTDPLGNKVGNFATTKQYSWVKGASSNASGFMASAAGGIISQNITRTHSVKFSSDIYGPPTGGDDKPVTTVNLKQLDIVAKRSHVPFMQNPMVRYSILNNVKNTGGIKYGEGLGYETEWMKDFNKSFGLILNAGVAAPLAAEFVVPIVAHTGIQTSIAAYDGALTGAAHIYFRWQVYAGTVSGTGTGGILLGRGMKDYVIPTANRIGLGYLRMPSFVQWGNRTKPMIHYNRLWLNYHLQSGSNVSVMTNAVSPAFPYSPFMDMELKMLMRFYGGK